MICVDDIDDINIVKNIFMLVILMLLFNYLGYSHPRNSIFIHSQASFHFEKKSSYKFK